MVNDNLLIEITVLGRCKTKKLEKIKNVKSTKADSFSCISRILF